MAADEIVPTTLIVPADGRRSLARARSQGVGAVVFDLAVDDATAPARGAVVDALGADGWGAVRRLVRVNGWRSQHTYRDVVEVIESAGEHVEAVVLPDVRTPHDAAALDLLLAQIERTMGLPLAGIGIVAQLDDARGVQAAAAVAGLARVRSLACNVCEFGTAVRLAARAAGKPAYCLAVDGTDVAAAHADGFDGVWVDDPDLVTVATDVFA